jgi:hypothetical protein
MATSNDSTSRPENGDTIAKSKNLKEEDGSKEAVPSLVGFDEAAAIPKGTIDPVYEAKARVLNHAVCFSPPFH